MVVILTMVNLSAHSKINCQVRAVFCIIFFTHIDWLQFQGLGHYRLREYPHPGGTLMKERDILSLDFCLHGLLLPRCSIDDASHVSFYAPMIHGTTTLP